MTRIERPKSLTELVANALRAEIVQGDLELGTALSESSIASRMEVSRTPVREAFARLELEGLVRSEPQRGTFVFTLDPQALADICAVRVSLETTALHTAMERDALSCAKALGAIVDAMTKARAAGDDREYLRLDTEFHDALVRCSGNQFLSDAYQTIASKMAALRNRLGAHPDHMRKSYEEHGRMVEQIAAGDFGAAIKTLTYHIGRKEGSYWNRDQQAAL